MLLLTGKQETDSNTLNNGINFGILLIPGILAIYYPHVGKLAGIMGAFVGLATIYILPTVTYLKQEFTAIDHPELVEATRGQRPKEDTIPAFFELTPKPRRNLNDFESCESYDRRPSRD